MNSTAIRATYEVFGEVRDIAYVGRRETFGIIIRQGVEETRRVPDISTDREKVEQLAELCTRKDVSPDHFMDVLEDIWASNAF